MLRLLSFCLSLMLLSYPACLLAEEKAPALPPQAEIAAHAHAAAESLNRLYWSPTLSIWLDRTGDDVRGHFDGRVNPPWWSAANAVESLLDLMEATGSAQYQPMIESLYEIQRDKANKVPRIVAELKKRGQWSDADQQKLQRREAETEKRKRERVPGETLPPKALYGTEFRNEYLDDSGWWGLAWVRMYERTKAPKYLVTARAIHAHMARNWQPEKGGGIMWCEDADKHHPNAITNSLFIILSAKLHEHTREAEYLRWAEKTMEWYRTQKLYDGTAIVDAPGHRGDYWTYNQGTYLGALIALHRATGKEEYLDEAARAAETIIDRSGVVLPAGVIFEKLGTKGWDPGMFKGVFARYLGKLRDVLAAAKKHPDVVDRIDRVLRASAASLLASGVAADGQYSISWEQGGTDQARNFNTQASALALLIANLRLANPWGAFPIWVSYFPARYAQFMRGTPFPAKTVRGQQAMIPIRSRCVSSNFDTSSE